MQKIRKITLISSLVALFLNIQCRLFLNDCRSEIRTGWAGLGPTAVPRSWLWPQPRLAGWSTVRLHPTRGGKDTFPPPVATLAYSLGQNGITLEEIRKKHLCPAEHNSVQKMSCSKSCSSSRRILGNLPGKHCFWSCSCPGLRKS